MALTFDIRDYEAQFAEGRRLLEASHRLEEPARVPVQMSFDGSFQARLVGANIRDFYADVEASLEIQVKALKWILEECRDDRAGASIGFSLGAVQEALYWGGEIVRPDDVAPWAVKWLKTPEDIERLPVPEPEECPGIQEHLAGYERMKATVQKMGLNVPVTGGINIHPPLSAACALMEPELVFYYMAREPTLIHQFFAKLLAGWLKLKELNERYFGSRSRSVGLADDHSAFVSDEMYRRMVLPYNLTIYERYGKEGRSLHADGPNDHHFETYANILKLTAMDIGGYSDIVKAKLALTGHTAMSGGIDCRDVYYDFAAAKPAVDRALRILAPGGGYVFAVGGSCAAGVNADTVVEVVRYVKEVGRYPLDLAALDADAETEEVLGHVRARLDVQATVEG